MKQEDSNHSQNQESKSKILIENKDLLLGVYSCLHNTEKFFDSSKLLFDNKDYQSSIPIATISIEESMKGQELLKKFRHNKDVTVDNWELLKNHKYKLNHVIEDSIRYLKDVSDEDINKIKEETAITGIQSQDISVNDAIKSLENRLHVQQYFQQLREGCFYSNWDRLKNKWMVFDELPKEKQEVLAFFVLDNARGMLVLLKRAIERYVNRLRETGQLQIKLPYPSYKELRPVEKWESNSLSLQIEHKRDRIRFARGYEVMTQFIEQKSFQFLSFGIFRKAMREYLKVISKQKDEEWFPHPMIKAMIMALSIVQEKKKEGEKITMISGDADQTYSGKPMNLCAATITLKSGICEFVRIVDVSCPEIEFTQDMIEKIIRSEIIIERNQGKEIPPNLWIEASNVIGIRTKMIKLEEIPEAIRFMKELIQSNKLEGVTKDIVDQANAIKGVEEWDDLDTNLRAGIASCYGAVKYPGYDAYMTPSDNIRKFKCRSVILHYIVQSYLPTA